MWQAIATLGAGLLGAHSQKQTNKKQIALAKEQMAFQERMANTSHQRQMEDLRQAGLNPLMATKLGGASSPSGAMAQIKDPAMQASMISNAVNQARLSKYQADIAEQDFNTMKNRGLSKSVLGANPLNLLINSVMNRASEQDLDTLTNKLLTLFGVGSANASVLRENLPKPNANMIDPLTSKKITPERLKKYNEWWNRQNKLKGNIQYKRIR